MRFFIAPEIVGQMIEFINEQRPIDRLGRGSVGPIENISGFLEGRRFRPVQSSVVSQPVGMSLQFLAQCRQFGGETRAIHNRAIGLDQV